MIDSYANRAHNDAIELWLEAGAAGIVLMALFLAWLVAASWRLWRRDGAEAVGIDLLLARAATVIVALLVAHSFVDYPLRTGAMMALLAFACGLLIAPPVGAEDEDKASADRPEARRRKAERPEARQREPAESPIAKAPQRPRTPASAPASPPVVDRPGEPWGQGIQWPEEWRSSTTRPAPKPSSPKK